MKLIVFLESLRASDASVAQAILDLLRHADDDGTIDRAAWLAALQRTYSGADADLGTEADVAGYLDEHVVPTLTHDGLIRLEPQADAWERATIDPEVWAEIRSNRGAAIERAENAARTLLHEPVRPPARVTDPSIRRGSSLSAKGLMKVYRRRRVVNEVDVAVSQGEIVGLLGPNGAGKTTTFYMMVGLISPDSGAVYMDDEELTRTPMYKRARKGIGYLAQEPSIFRKLTVEENILAILETMPLSKREREERLEELLDELGIKHLRESQAYSLSGGERRRLEITRALVSNPKFMLLDEPFAGVDPIAVHDIQQIVADLRLRGIGVIISDHNVEQTLDIVDRAYIMYEGRVRVAGTVAELVWNEEVADIYFGPTLTARMRERYRRPEVAV